LPAWCIFLADLAEAVDVAVAAASPIHEFDAELERAHRLADEVVFVQVQRLVVEFDHRDRGFAHADGADFLGFHQPDRIGSVQHFRQRRGGHPAGGAAAHDHNFRDAASVDRYSVHAS
jgi:hypothetical protein